MELVIIAVVTLLLAIWISQTNKIFSENTNVQAGLIQDLRDDIEELQSQVDDLHKKLGKKYRRPKQLPYVLYAKLELYRLIHPTPSISMDFALCKSISIDDASRISLWTLIFFITAHGMDVYRADGIRVYTATYIQSLYRNTIFNA